MSEPRGVGRLWSRLFLEERPSMGLSFFRIAAALATGFYVLPTFFPLSDTYLHTAFKTFNFNFFPVPVIQLVQKSPDSLVIFFVALFCVSWFAFLVGLFSQISCVVMTLCCYYFYALNHFALGHALTWDILLVTLFLMCVTPYPGDYFSVDCLRCGDPAAYRRERPFFLQRLLQMQIGFTYFYTALYKLYPAGNWLTGNPVYYLMHYPPAGVIKNFLLKDSLAAHPGLCYAFGLFIVIVEFLMIFLLFWRQTRISAIYLGFVFHILLILTMDVPAIFFFLFPPQLLLFINPKRVAAWIEGKRAFYQKTGHSRLIYDGQCGFCRVSLRQLQIMDLFGVISPVDYHQVGDIQHIHPGLTRELAHSQLHLIEPDGTLYGGFDVFRRLCFQLPMLYPMIPVFYFPGAGWIGPAVYRLVSRNRYLFHSSRICQDNVCSPAAPL